MKARLDSLEDNLKKLIDRFDARTLTHEENAKTMNEFCIDNNRLRLEIAELKTEQAVNKTIVTQYAELTKELKIELRGLGDKIVAEMASIKTSLAISSDGRLTKRWWIERILQAGTWAAVLLTIIYKS